MENKAIISSVITGVAVAVIMSLLGWASGVFRAGTDAATEAEVKRILGEVLMTDDDVSYSKALSDIKGNQKQILTEVGGLKDDVNQLESAILLLASD